MPINSNIALGVKPLQIESPVTQLANVLQIQGAQQANEFNGMKMDAYRQTSERQSKLQALLGGLDPNATDDDRISALRRGSFLDEADKVETSVANRRKTQSESTARDAETENKVISVYRDLAGVAKDPMTAAEYIKAMHSDPRLKNTAIARVPLDQALSQIGQDPESFNAWKQQFALGAEKFITQNKPTYQTTSTGKVDTLLAIPGLGGAPTVAATTQKTTTPGDDLQAQTTRANNAASVAATIRGQNLTDARSKESNRIASENKQEKPLTEGQAKSALFGSRMATANQIFDTLEQSGTTTSTPGINSGYGVGNVISALSSADQQQLMQAKRDFLNAVLRRESGAVIGESEFDGGNKQYFPQVGDSKEVIAQKRANRETAMRGVLIDVPEGRRAGIVGEITGKTGGTAPTSSGFKYLGTD